MKIGSNSFYWNRKDYRRFYTEGIGEKRRKRGRDGEDKEWILISLLYAENIILQMHVPGLRIINRKVRLSPK